MHGLHHHQQFVVCANSPQLQPPLRFSCKHLQRMEARSLRNSCFSYGRTDPSYAQLTCAAASKGGGASGGNSHRTPRQSSSETTADLKALVQPLVAATQKGGGSPGGGGGPMQRLVLEVAYDGTAFAGFQFQAGKVRTVQGELEKAARRLFVGCSRMVGASRTDGGAHAQGQVAHFDIFGSRDSLEADLMFLNAFLPPDVKVTSLRIAPPGFDAHFSSLGKTYAYHITTGVPDPCKANHSWWVYSRYCERARGPPLSPGQLTLDVEAMRRAAEEVLLGTHDFTALMDNRRPSGLGSLKRKRPHLAEKGIRPVRTSSKNIRTLGEVRLEESRHPLTGAQQVTLWLTGDGFLYRQVRMIAAALVEVGHGRLTPERLKAVLEAGDRSQLPEAAPPTGLFLHRVWYDQEGMLARCGDPAGREALAKALAAAQDKKARLRQRAAQGAAEGVEDGEVEMDSDQDDDDDDGDGPSATVAAVKARSANSGNKGQEASSVS